MDEDSTILVPVDFSSHSHAAAERACVIAKACGAQIRLLHALHVPSAAIEYEFSKAIWKDLRHTASEKLDEFAHGLEGRGLKISTSMEVRDPSDAIRAEARSPDVSLIVMGSHGRRGIDRLILGSVAERTLHGASVPVMIVHEDEAEAAKDIRSVLFATDFSDDAECAEKTVAKWARALHAEVEVFHAIREATVLFAPYAVAGSSDYEGEMKEAAKRRIEGSLERFESAGVSARSRIVYGFASEEIVKRAESSGVDLIAMGTRGYSGLRRFRLGSVVQRVVRHGPCSVLVAAFRSPDELT